MAAAALCEHFGTTESWRSARQNGHEQQQGDDAEVLKEHDADDQPAVRRVELIPAPQLLEHDRGARQRDEEPDEETETPAGQRARKQEDEHDDRCGGGADLERAADEHLAPDATDLGERELQADGEEQQHDAHLRQHLDIVLRLDDADACRPGDRAGDDERDDRRDPDPAEDENEDQCDRVGQHQFGQGRVSGHASV